MSIVSQYLFINSADRINGTSNDFQIQLKDINNDFEDMSLTIQNLSIPFSFYPINSNNNVITIGTTQTATITKGNYTANSFLNEFITDMPFGITGAYNTSTGKFSFGTTNASSWSITANSNQQYLGLSAGLHSSTSGVITSDQLVNLSGPREIRILTDIPIYSTNTTDYNKDVLISVYPNTTFGSMINYTLHNFAHIKMACSNINIQRFSLVDENNQHIDLNKLDWSMTLLLTSNSLQE